MLEIIGANETILGYNLYAYCDNNPIMNVDYNGNFTLALGAINPFVAMGIVAVGIYAVYNSKTAKLPSIPTTSDLKMKDNSVTNTKTNKKSKT